MVIGDGEEGAATTTLGVGKPALGGPAATISVGAVSRVEGNGLSRSCGATLPCERDHRAGHADCVRGPRHPVGSRPTLADREPTSIESELTPVGSMVTLGERRLTLGWSNGRTPRGSWTATERKITDAERRLTPFEIELTIDERRLTIDEGWGSRQPP